MADKIKTTGIVLKSNKHTIEASKLLEIFSPEMGKFSAVIRGVEKPKAKLSVASQPFCFGEFVLAERNGFYTVTDCYVYDSFFNLAYNLDGYVLGASMLEATSKIVQTGQENLELFKLLLNSLKVIIYENAEPTAVTIKYLMELLKSSGFGFDIIHCHVCGKNISNDKVCGLIYEGSGAICEKDSYKIENMMAHTQTIDNILNLITMILSGIAGISLVVSGISVMTVMMFSVSERTHEIGIKKALGASYFDIFFEFLVEAIVITLIGCATGTALGIAASYIGLETVSMPIEFDYNMIGICVVVTAAFGLIFGIYPAICAARLEPATALRRK